ncbi:MAG: ATP-binding protein [Chloroflexota bacterium]
MGKFDRNGQVIEFDQLPLVRSVRHGEVVRGEQLVLKVQSSHVQVPVLLNSAPLRDPDDAIVGGVLLFQDITAIKDLERQKDEFLAAASHALKNPLATIKARAQLLTRKLELVQNPDSVSLVEGLRSIDHATRRLVGIVNELFDVARLRMDRPIELEFGQTDLAALVPEVSEQVQASTDRHRIVAECCLDTLEGEWDNDRVERVLVNLLTNAIKYSPECSTITMTLDTESRDGRDWAIVQVRDEGMGIPPAELPHIFERFYRASNVPARIEGAGIGLSGVRHMTEKHGGEVTADSVLGEGSIFTVRLPITDKRSD